MEKIANHRVVEIGRDLWYKMLLLQQGLLDSMARENAQVAFKYRQGIGLHNRSR